MDFKGNLKKLLEFKEWTLDNQSFARLLSLSSIQNNLQELEMVSSIDISGSALTGDAFSFLSLQHPHMRGLKSIRANTCLRLNKAAFRLLSHALINPSLILPFNKDAKNTEQNRDFEDNTRVGLTSLSLDHNAQSLCDHGVMLLVRATGRTLSTRCRWCRRESRQVSRCRSAVMPNGLFDVCAVDDAELLDERGGAAAEYTH